MGMIAARARWIELNISQHPKRDSELGRLTLARSSAWTSWYGFAPGGKEDRLKLKGSAMLERD